jgi:arylsulfatase A-like enzyme
LAPSIVLLPEELKKRGFKTIALSTMANISPFFGFQRGFDRFVEIYKEETAVRKRKKITYTRQGEIHFRKRGDDVPIVTSEDINSFLLPYLEENRESDVFVLAWSLDTHDPYFHRDRNLAQFVAPAEEMWLPKDIKQMHSEEERLYLKALYADMIYYNDVHIGALIKKLKEMRVYDRTFFVLTSDHGEAFGEHRVSSHGGTPYDELVRVPLIMKFPRGEFSGTRAGLVQHIDVAPTILESTGKAERVNLWQGKSLSPLIRTEQEVNDFVFADTQLNRNLPRCLMLRDRNHKYIELNPGKFAIHRSLRQTLSPIFRSVIKQKMFFCLKEDPEENVNLFRLEKERAHVFQSRLRLLLRECGIVSKGLQKRKGIRTDIDDEVADQLHAMGYFD